MVLDADDRLRPGALDALRPPLDGDSRLGFTYGITHFFGDWHGELSMPAYDPYKLLYRHIIGSTCLFRREVLDDVGGFDPAFRGYEDWEFWLHALQHGWRGQQVREVTFEYRRHGETMIASARRDYPQWYRRLRHKHALLYARRSEFAGTSETRPISRLVYRWWWGPRPLPARVEVALHQLLWGPARWRSRAASPSRSTDKPVRTNGRFARTPVPRKASAVRTVLERLRSARPLPAQLLRVDAVRSVVAYSRFQYFTRRGGVRTLTDGTPAVSALTVEHNLKGLTDLTVVRSQMLLRPLSVIEEVPADARVLAIGPRTEGELLNLVAHGFRRENIRGLDLISYSPWVDLGDMHAMPYADSSWDVVVLAWVLAYSDDWPQVVREVVRVAKPGAVVAIGVEYNPRSDEDLAAEHGYRIGAQQRLETTDMILALFEGAVGTVYFRHDVQPARRDRLGSVATIFSVQKKAP